jgi:hypothetical protein
MQVLLALLRGLRLLWVKLCCCWRAALSADLCASRPPLHAQGYLQHSHAGIEVSMVSRSGHAQLKVCSLVGVLSIGLE